MEKIKVGASSCLLGEKVRYDGGHKLDPFVARTLEKYFEYVAVCPEVEYGLSIPREPMHLAGDVDASKLVATRTGIDHTEGMLRWAAQKVKLLEQEGLAGFIFKSRSPSSGMHGVKVYPEEGPPVKKGVGLFARTFMTHFPLIPVEDENRLNDARIRENFIERIFVYHRWQEFRRKGAAGNLAEFHTDHKLTILSHSPRHYSRLGKLIAGGRDREDLHAAYIAVLMDGMKLTSTVKKNRNVLYRIMGYFKKRLSADEKQELMEAIERYHSGLVPLIVPVTLLKHYVRRYDEPSLWRQHYLNPHPAELMLRSHV